MDIKYLLLRLMDEEGGCIESKTKIQKQLYFLSKKLDLDFGFKPHYYGPYSPIVAEALDELVGSGFATLQVKTYGIDTQRGFEMSRYDYSISESGKKLLKELGKSDEQIIIRDFVNKLESIGNPDTLIYL